MICNEVTSFKRVPALLLLVIMLIMLPAALLSAADQAPGYGLPESRHGGYFGRAGTYDVYHYEIVRIDAQNLQLYVYDENAQPINIIGISARWRVAPGTAQSFAGQFDPNPSGEFYSAFITEPYDEPLHILVEVMKLGVWVPVEFHIPAKPAAGDKP